MRQINKYNPPPNPTKLTDARAGGYIKKYGHDCWELDALEPAVITELIKKEVSALENKALTKHIVKLEEQDKHHIQRICDRFDDILDFLN